MSESFGHPGARAVARNLGKQRGRSVRARVVARAWRNLRATWVCVGVGMMFGSLGSAAVRSRGCAAQAEL
eukprot:6618567-Pyramimonas_sp.AAC.1